VASTDPADLRGLPALVPALEPGAAEPLSALRCSLPGLLNGDVLLAETAG
jgi:hypothetical protein